MKAIFLGCALFFSSHGAFACAIAPSDVRESIEITDESAVIVWDKEKGVEHFVRRASFETKSRDFAFLVPTPSQPELAEADEAAFATLRKAMEPKRETRVKPNVRFMPMILAPFFWNAGQDESESADGMKSAVGGVDSAVEVLETRQIAGYDASVLSAENPVALGNWLREHGYSKDPALADWLAPYVKAKWKITAFKIAKNAKDQAFQSSLVRMSFKTPAPIFPYREPETQRQLKNPSPRSLRVYFLGTERVNGSILTDTDEEEWPSSLEFSANLESAERTELVSQLKLKDAQLPVQTRLTTFDDFSSPRPGFGDLAFTPSPDQKTVTPPPIIIYQEQLWWFPLDVVALVIGLPIWFFRRRKLAM